MSLAEHCSFTAPSGQSIPGQIAMLSGKPVWMAVRDCGGRGPYANSIGGRAGLEVCRGCAAGHNPRHFAPEKLATVKECREDYRCGGWKKRSVWWRAREIRSVPRHAEFLRWRAWFHAADPIKRGNRRTARPEVELRMESFEIIAAGDPAAYLTDGLIRSRGLASKPHRLA